MLKQCQLAFSLIFLFLISVQPVRAIVNPLAVPNNRFGIHILEEIDLLPAAKLVNSQGGDWGYVTLVIRQNDRNQDKWQAIFDNLRRLHLIPIVRLATYSEKNYWVKPEVQDIDTWVSFLSSLNWVVQNRYIVLFNEPNHALEWGDSLNPKEYGEIARQFHDKLTAASSDFFILPAGLDTAAPNSPNTMSAVNYWQQMFQADKQIFQIFDGWNSHSYPNPNFSGSPTASGLGTLQSYQAEITYLTKFGLQPNLPIFITETGWTHKDGNILGASDPASNALSQFYVKAFTQIWNQPNLVAITPFILNYSQPPFTQFSWQKPNSDEFFPHYFAVQSLVKIAGKPIQINSSQLLTNNLASSLVDSSDYEFSLNYKNTGQSIWDPTDFSLLITGNFPNHLIQVSQMEITEPDKTTEFTIKLKTPADHNDLILGLQLSYQGKPFGEKTEQVIKIVPPPTLIAKVKSFLKRSVSGNDFSLLIYNQNNQLQFKTPLTITQGQSQPVALYNLVPNNLYRFVLLKPKFSPRQLYVNLNPEETIITFKTLIPELLYNLFHPLNYFRLSL